MHLNESDDNASRPTEGNLEHSSSAPSLEEKEEFDSDAMLDPPEQKVGDIMDVTYDSKVKKEILEVRFGKSRNF